MLRDVRNKFFGTKQFYKMILAVAVPIMVQSGFTNLVNMLDNLMVGRVGTDPMSGVAIANQLIFVYNLAIFGGISGAGIFAAQYHGRGSVDGVRNIFRIKLVLCAAMLAVGLAVLRFFGTPLIGIFLHDGSVTGDLAATQSFSEAYLRIMLVGLIPFTATQACISTLRETGETVAPMRAGIAAVLVNLVFNWLLIFGKLGFPALGVSGAAIATVFSRFVEFVFIAIWMRRNRAKAAFSRDVFKNFRVPSALIKQVARKGTPLMLNEFLWSAGMTMLLQCYSTRGLATVAALNICSTINNLFNVVFIALGASVSIVVGQLLGAGRMQEARETDTRMITFSFLCCLVIAAVMAVLAPVFPRFYNTTDEVRVLASSFIRIMALLMPFCACTHAAYFTLRSGGKTIVTFLFDSCFAWVVCVPVALLLSRFTDLPAVSLYLCCQSLDILKCAVGLILVKKGLWLHNMVEDPSPDAARETV